VYFSNDFCAVVSNSHAVVRFLATQESESMSRDEYYAKYAGDMRQVVACWLQVRDKYTPVPLEGVKRVGAFTISSNEMCIPGGSFEPVLILRHPKMPCMILLAAQSNGWLDVWPADVDLDAASQYPTDHHVWTSGIIPDNCTALLTHIVP
jgi:hypothetical protein